VHLHDLINIGIKKQNILHRLTKNKHRSFVFLNKLKYVFGFGFGFKDF